MKHNYLIVFISVLLVASLNLAGYSQDSVSASPPKVVKSELDSNSIQKKNINKSTDSTKQTKSKSLKEELTTPPSISDIISLGKIFWAIVIFVIGIFLIKFASKLLELSAERSAKYRISIKGIIPVVRIFGWSLVIYIIISGVFQPPAATLLALAASLGIAIGFAAQDIFKNIFGGIMILFDRPFQVGDKIEAGQYYGEVVKIGLRSTRIVTGDDSLVSIPNGDIMTRSVSNSNTGEANCQVVAEIYLPITVDTEKVRQIATEAAQVSKYIYLDKPIAVLFFNEIKERRSYFKMRLKAYVMDIRYEFPFKSDMTELVIKELLKQKIISPSDFA
ncbi:MAG: mechanosensitive ion channel family protein [Ignavibacteriaceae bacterium]|nr:mechanosensitive ion channel family protein [Ignavibacteriaceae bacterium]HRP93056.1 mechanosensitive ion channel [Ignavibacteriaceae bacterium]HRQ52692.1 mechanosensitive ion channel [Ignavibacteriaceae bacterium]